MQPWSLAGFIYEDPALMPVCWRYWAWDFIVAKAAAQAEAQKRAAAG